MRYFIVLLFLVVSNTGFGQDVNLHGNGEYFSGELKLWTSSFCNFHISHFKLKQVLNFAASNQENFKDYDSFLFTYSPIMTFSKDSSEFIDIYSYQLNLEKKDSVYYANPDIDQEVYWCDIKSKHRQYIYFGDIDDAIWISNSKFILVGTIENDQRQRNPLILIGDIKNKTLEEYLTDDKNCYQKNRYNSPKLQNIKIMGL